MVRLLPIASGKGGVGKSVVAANLGIALARAGRTVVLVDLDLGGSNLHTFLGIRNKNVGIAHLRRGGSIADLLVETGRDRLWLVPGDCLVPGAANIEYFAKKRILKELAALPADYVVMDLGAGSSNNVVDFFLSAADGFVVMRAEITSVLNAYSFLKSVAYRTILRSYPERSPARAELAAFAAERDDGEGLSYMDFALELAERYPERSSVAADQLAALAPRVVMNMVVSDRDLALGDRLRGIASRRLGIELRIAAVLPEDPEVPASLSERSPVAELVPLSPFSTAIADLAAAVDGLTPPGAK
ncbi:MAG: P-loop NTPase [Spirochaetaceae bacterium]|nr:P-loop NTPase [Spirochaetaceae bacterium]